jgi:hypothetical protein
VRRDLRPSFGSASGVAAGVPLTIELTVLDLPQRALAAHPLRGLPATGLGVALTARVR